MKCAKSILKLAGVVMVMVGAVLVVLGSMDEVKVLFSKIALCKARKAEMKDYAD